MSSSYQGYPEQVPSMWQSNPELKRHLREALLIGAKLHLEAMLSKDALSTTRFESSDRAEAVKQFVSVSFTNALSDTQADELQKTFTMCFEEREPAGSSLSARTHFRRMLIHIPTDLDVKPLAQEEIDEIPVPEKIFVEYQTPVFTRFGRYDSQKITRFVVKPDDVFPYYSYDARAQQQDEVDIYANEPERLFDSKMFDEERKFMEVTNMISVIDQWAEKEVGWLGKK